jgi:hypothetical protein
LLQSVISFPHGTGLKYTQESGYDDGPDLVHSVYTPNGYLEAKISKREKIIIKYLNF